MMKNFPHFSKLRVESLEERTLLAVMAGGIEQVAELAAPTEAQTWIVNTLEDPADWDTTDDILSLREAIDRAATGDVIVFDSVLTGGTITLNGNQLSVSKGIMIDASAIGGITIDANRESRAFYICGGNETDPVELIGLAIIGGRTDGHGGGIYCDRRTLTLVNSILSENTANSGAGIYYGDTSGSSYYSLSLIHCAIEDNTADADGGGIFYCADTRYFDSPLFLLANCIVSGNISHGSGGGICLNMNSYDICETAKIVNCTIAGNFSNLQGGGICSTALLDLYNTIAAENDSGNLGEDIFGFQVYGYNSLSSFTNWATENYDGWPNSSRCIPYDPNRPLFNDSENGDYSLAKQSQAINRGENSYIDGIATDISGNQRISGQAVDIGAYEFQRSGNIEHEVPSVIVTTELDIVDETDGIISLREAIAYALPEETVQFANNLKGRTFKLYDGELIIDKNVSIDATNICGASIDADKRSRVIKVSGGSEDSPVLLIGLTITNGNSETVGGGLYNNGVLKLINTTVVENQSAEIGGGICNNGILTLTNCTVTDNKASENGSGLYNDSGVIFLYNTIVAENGEDESLRDIFIETGSSYAYNSLSSFADWTDSASCIIYDSSKPLFCRPSDYYTNDFDYKIPYRFLCENSQAIDKGNNNYINGYATDIFGISRTLNGNVDIGAHEYIKEAESTVVTTTLDVINSYDNVISLREAIERYGNSGEAITFDTHLTGETIMLNGAIYLGGRDITIDASGIGGITLDGNGTQHSDFHYGILLTGGDSAHIELIGLTLTHGYNSRAGHGGGAICNSGGHLTLTDCCITRSYAANGIGGGIVNFGGEINLINCVVSNNCVGGSSGQQVGGGICNWSGNITLTGCDILENYALNGGGGISLGSFGSGEDNTVVITNCNISGNSAEIGAGVSSSRPLIMTGCKVSENASNGSYGYGISIAGIHSSSDLTLINCSITRNKAGKARFGAYNIGGIYVGGNLEVTNCTIARNEAGLPSSAHSAGGVYCYGHTFVFRNSIVVQNTANEIESDINIESGLLNIENTLTSEQGSYMYDPSLPLFTDPDNGDFTLTENSQAINRGKNEYLETIADLAGNPRISDSIIDLGAYEYQSDGRTFEPVSTIVTTNLDVVNFTDNQISLREAIRFYANEGDIITFDASLAGQTITLDGNELIITNGVSIDASGIGGITINAGNKSRVFNVSGKTENTAVELIGLKVTGGLADNGGGICNNLGTLTLTNCVVTGNSASDCGGGIYNSPTLVLTLINCTVAGNGSGYSGGGIYHSRGMLTLYNTIIALNHADFDRDIGNYNSALGDHNLIGIDPHFTVPPVFQSGKVVNLDKLDLTLTAGSWAIDRGLNSIVEIETDLAGNPRLYASWEETTTVDIGAYEYQERIDKEIETPSLVVTTTLDIVDDTDGLISLREAILYAESGETITFDNSLAEGIITLNGTELLIDKGITIDAESIGGITIDADMKSRVFYLLPEYNEISVKFINLTITGGRAIYGGGIHAYYGTLTLTGCTVSGNSADCGGGIYNSDVNVLLLTNCSVTRNSANKDGGGIYNSGSSPFTLMNCVVIGNSANSRGGGIYNYCSNKTTIITNSTISGNTAPNGGGIYNDYNTTMTLTNCTVSKNFSGGRGGGIYNYGTLKMTNCMIVRNSVMNNPSYTFILGGGIYNQNSLTLTNCTVAGNDSSYSGGGIHNEQGTADLCNTIIVLNTSSVVAGDVDLRSGSIYASNTLSTYSKWTGSSNCLMYDSSKPLFTDASNGVYTLTEGSQAINKGTNSYISSYYTDLAGNARIVNGTVDIGAYEYDPSNSNDQIKQLGTPIIMTGNKAIYVSAGANRHKITWGAISSAIGYELAYSENGQTWTTFKTYDTSLVVSGLAYGKDVQYKVRAIADSSHFSDSDWSAVKVFNVCPVDINNDGDITGGDRTLLGNSWLSEVGEDEYRSYCDINGDGDIGGADRVYLSNNWLLSVEDDADDLLYPPAKVSDAVFAGFASADLAADLSVF